MLFGQSVFQSVVERLKQEKEEEGVEPPPPAGHRIAGFSSGFVLDTHIEAPLPSNGNLDAYLAFMAEPAPPPEPQPEPEPEAMPAHLEKTSLADVSAELAIHETDTAATLAEKRRAFARLNHPDRVKPQFRHNATLRMTAANLLVDQAIRMLRTREHFR
ncbi:hypothetical protein G6L67_11765 [Agrobacterium tumefaciens]|jgi:hypothetical protein|uniref:J domain-containing protein n=1 Tax=Agrobacterium tumefaciens str. Kerr 14 TaxID=1183424 RepID=A0A1S7P059_AGRTU|nr:hypothetical protein [Agrobacterium tumefaciens]AYM81849.1 hypothetical protein At12D1_19620 [Agrobacterium tumefaciens]NTE92528.1 hypothetical protein [Agrobacterium tumefaciens]CUX14079.1 conserved hypothetical protein [Agrobacterium tumefaciens str. Kerr 14]